MNPGGNISAGQYADSMLFVRTGFNNGYLAYNVVGSCCSILAGKSGSYAAGK